MSNAPKTVLAIHDLPGFGRAALSVIVPVLSALGVQAVALPTAVLSTHTGGLGTPAKLSNPGYGPAALDHYHRLGLQFDCIYSGYLADGAQAHLVEQAFTLWPNALKVVDPVMGDGGQMYRGLSADLVQAMQTLCARADVIVPNMTEAALLLDRLQAAHGQHGGNGIISGASKSGKIMDAKHGFGCWKNHKRVPSFYTGCPWKADHKKIPVDLPLCFCLLPSGSTTYTDTFYHKCRNKKR